MKTCFFCEEDLALDETDITETPCGAQFHEQCMRDCIGDLVICPGCDQEVCYETMESCVLCGGEWHPERAPIAISATPCGKLFHDCCVRDRIFDLDGCPGCNGEDQNCKDYIEENMDKSCEFM